MEKYSPKDIERKWQRFWEKNRTFEVGEDTKKEKFYGLIEFPYPSGSGLHVGHPRSYTAMDIICRKRRMQGYNVLYPIGFDSFGLPTENFAIQTGRPPAEITAENIATFTRQLKSLGFSFDWSRAVTTSEPEYYRWTQWIFLQFFRRGLAYKANQPINWCLNCKIGLANEEVVDGRCERCGGPVEKRNKEQWMLAITKYADKLLEGLKEVDYIERAKVQQENWIGKSEGALVRFTIPCECCPNRPRGPGSIGCAEDKVLEVFTTRPDTLFGATYVVLAPEHALVPGLKARIKNWRQVSAYVQAAKKKTDIARAELAREKTGLRLEGVRAVNPVNGERLPVWVADYVLGHYGAGAIMAVPAHDERDWEFARRYGLPVREVVQELVGDTSAQEKTVQAYEESFQEYFDATPKGVAGQFKDWIDGMLAHVSRETAVLEIGSGFGRDADYMESQGYKVERTDVAQSFIDYHRQAGKLIRKLDILHHSLPVDFYLAIFANGVLHHFNSKQTEYVMKKINRSLKIDGLFAFSVRFGEFEGMITAKISRERFLKHWLPDNLKEILSRGGFAAEYLQKTDDDRFLLVIAKKLNDAGAFTGDGVSVNSDFLNGLRTSEAKAKITTWLTERGLGARQVQYKLRDWVFSRQRYWGEPIPLVYCEKCEEWVAVPESELPLTLPKVAKYQPTDTGESPLAAMTKWVKTKCPRCGGPARRETDTMPNWAGSSWYFLRYSDPKNKKELAAMKKLKYWLGSDEIESKEQAAGLPRRSPKSGGGVDWYNGGMEHTVLHLLYSRFWNQFLHDIGVAPTREPYKKRTSHGMILAKGGHKMSKSKGNVVNPDEMVAQFGADALRAYIMFMGPFDQAVEWDTNGLVGVRRFLDKVWGLQEKVAEAEKSKVSDLKSKVISIPAKSGGQAVKLESGNSKLTALLHQTIKKVTEDIEAMRFNTAVSQFMILTNALASDSGSYLPRADFEKLALLLSPFAPHLAEELWARLGHKTTIAYEPWPAYDEELARGEEMTIVVQVNGKVRDEFTVSISADEEEIKSRALASEQAQKWLAGKKPQKVIYVAGRLVSIVV